MSFERSWIAVPCAALVCSLFLGSCGPSARALSPKSQTWAELRMVRRDVKVLAPGEKERSPYPRERLVDGEKVTVSDGGLAWLRRDGGSSLLVAGPAAVEMQRDGVVINEGRVFVDTPPGEATRLTTPRGPLQMSHVRSSLTVGKDGTVKAYVLAGEVRTDATTVAGPGEELDLAPSGATRTPVLAWEDWTGGLATTDRAAAPAPFGIGTVGARLPGELGSARWPLAIQRLDVTVKITADFAVTEVDQTFFNPTSQTVEGMYGFRTPPGAVLERFGVDRDDSIVWGYVKEKQQAAAQYASHVYAGSTEDPALLEWDSPGVYRARLYPIAPGGSRRVVTRYAEWLNRSGERGERRLYVYPMAAEGAEATLPRIEELTVTVDLSQAGAKEVRAGMDGVREGQNIVVRAHDVIPRADLAVDLLDDGTTGLHAYRSPHYVDPDLLPPDARKDASKSAAREADYVLVPLRATARADVTPGLDLAIVVDSSAATDAGMLSIARAATHALLSHLGKEDRVAVWAGDVGLRPVLADSGKLLWVDAGRARAIESALARVDRGGATDLGTILADAAATLNPARRGAVVYIGDGKPTVGEMTLPTLRERLQQLPRPVRIFTFGVGDDANMGILAGVAHGAFSERLPDANTAARASLRLLEEAERPTWLGAKVSLGTGVERLYPREVGAHPSDETVLMVGRISGGMPREAVVQSSTGATTKMPIAPDALQDSGDLMRRWAEGRLIELLDEGAGRAAVVEVGMRFGVITPFTSLYVPTTQEARAQNLLGRPTQVPRKHESRSSQSWRRSMEDKETEQVAEANADNKEGGTGTRAKGEEGSMGNPNAPGASRRYGVAGPQDNADPHIARQGALREAAEFGMIGLLNAGAGGESAPAAAPAAAAPAPAPAATATAALEARLAAAEDEADKSKVRAAIEAQKDQPSRAPSGGKAPKPSTGSGGGGCAPGDPLCSDLDGVPAAAASAAGIPTTKTADSTMIVNGPAEGGHDARTGEADGEPLTKEGKLDKNVRATALVPQAPKTAGEIGHRALLCGPAASVPLEDRVALWKERLSKVSGNVSGVLAVYRNALAMCEAPSWRERSRLLSLMVDAMGNVRGQVQLWRALASERGTGDAVYGMILVRIRSANDMRELHDALGLRTIDDKALAAALKEAKTPSQLVQKLRGLAAMWPDDMSLSLRLMDALEDAGDIAGARDFARELRRKPDADASVRTAVGELYVRLAGKGGTEADRQEGLRTFGEIVEFGADDPVARRRLGDLLRAHGYYEQAARQYETLEQLMPDDATVPLLRAAASQGLGKIEEAVRWAEKAAGANAPDGASGSAKTARAIALTYLAWAWDDARKAKNDDLASRLLLRTKQQLGTGKTEGIRLSLAWAHPDFHPVLWTDALGAMMPAADGDALLGIAQSYVPGSRKVAIEIRFEPEAARVAARFGLEATLTAVIAEGTNDERVVRVPLKLELNGPTTLRYSLADGQLTKEAP